MEKIKDAWSSIPKPNKYVKNVSTKKFTHSPFDKDFLSIVDAFAGSDPLRPIMSSINFSEKGICVTDAHKLIYFNHKSEKYSGNYCTTKQCLKVADKKEIKDDKIDGKYPNFEAIIPVEYEYIYECDLLSIKTYIETIIRCEYTGKFRKDILFSFDDEKQKITFNGAFFIDVCNSFLAMGHRRVKIGIVSSSRPIILTPDLSFDFNDAKMIEKRDFCLLMPDLRRDSIEKQKNTDYGISEEESVDYQIDTLYSLSSDAVYSLDSKEYHKIDTNLTEKDSFEGYTLSIDEVDMFKQFYAQNNAKKSINIANFFKIKDKEIFCSDMLSTITLKNVDFSDGIYSLRGNAFFRQEFWSKRIDEYFTKPKFEDSQLKAEINLSELLFNLNLAVDFLGKDDLRPIMQGANLKSENDKILIQSTDATAGYRNIISNTKISSPFDVTIDDTKLLYKLLKYVKENELSLSEQDKLCKFAFNKLEFTFSKVDGKFPDLEKVYPSYYTSTINTKKSEITKIKKEVEELSKKHKDGKYKISISFEKTDEENKLKCSLIYDKKYTKESKGELLKEILIDASYENEGGNYESKIYPLFMPALIENKSALFGLKLSNIDRILQCTDDNLILSFTEPNRAIILDSVSRFNEKTKETKVKKEPKAVVVNDDNYLESKLKATELLLKFKRNSGSQEEIEYLESKINATKILIKFQSKNKFEEGGEIDDIIIGKTNVSTIFTDEKQESIDEELMKNQFGE